MHIHLTLQVYSYWSHTGANTSQESPVATNKAEWLKDSQGRFHLIRDRPNNSGALDIRDTQRGDNSSYFFLEEKGSSQWTYDEKWVSAHVSDKLWALAIPEDRGCHRIGMGPHSESG